MAKKILAVVLAVTIALSAMAITAFADYEIPLFKDANAYNTQSWNTRTYQVTFDIPVFGMYGYLTAGDYMKIDLPAYWGGNAGSTSEVKWSVQVNGGVYNLPTIKNDSANANKTVPVQVTLAYLWHHYNGIDTAIPQFTQFNQTTAIRLIAQFEIKDGADWVVNNAVNDMFTDKGSYANTMKAQWFKADGTEVKGSISYVPTWTPTPSSLTTPGSATYDFVNREWTYPTQGIAYDNLPFTWDHTLEARQMAMEAYENGYKVELHVPLTKPLVGQATYTLYANKGNSTYDYYIGAGNTYNGNGTNMWWSDPTARKIVDVQPLDGSIEEELVFNVPSDVLYEGKYGTFNTEFVIFEDITLLNSTVMLDYMTIDMTKVNSNAEGTLGRLGWPATWGGATARARFDGKDVNYASSGVAGTGTIDGYTNPAKSSAKFTVEDKGSWSWNVGEAITVADLENIDVATDYLRITCDQNTDQEKVTDDKSVINQQIPSNGLILKASDLNTTIKFISNASSARTTTFTVEVYGGDDIDPASGSLVVHPLDNMYGAIPTGATAHYTGITAIKADVKATNKVRLVIKTPEAAEEVGGETIDTPTDTTEQQGDDEGDDTVDLGDTEEPAKEENPKTGVALAVLPMLVAAAAAVASKKH